MLHEEDQRKAYLQLMTSFIMEKANHSSQNIHPKQESQESARVKYMISQAAHSKIELSAAGVQLYSMLKEGMTASEVIQLGNRICIERGYVLISDTCKRLYMHLNKNAQIWVELTQRNLDEPAVVTRKSKIERKSTWKIYRNNILKVSQE